MYVYIYIYTDMYICIFILESVILISGDLVLNQPVFSGFKDSYFSRHGPWALATSVAQDTLQDEWQSIYKERPEPD